MSEKKHKKSRLHKIEKRGKKFEGKDWFDRIYISLRRVMAKSDIGVWQVLPA
jgi:hypothetical protein